MPRFWMITNRNRKPDGLGISHGELSYWSCDDGPIDQLASWTEHSLEDFRQQLLDAANKFPTFYDAQAEHEDQKHICFFIHGYNNSWMDAARRYKQITESLFEGPNGLGICILFSWPSDGLAIDYLPDRFEVKRHSADFADVLSLLYDHLLDRQEAAATNPALACRAKLSVIAHSMGNYLLQEALSLLWARKNKPLLVSLFNQCVMVAADVDNDLFRTDQPGAGDGLANLTYRITALYSGKDSVLGASAGLKHFGTRRLGRSGLDTIHSLPDNVWDMDCTAFFTAIASSKVHSAYFDVDVTVQLLMSILRGVDRDLIIGSTMFGGHYLHI